MDVILALILGVLGLLVVALVFVEESESPSTLVSEAQRMAANRREYLRIEQEAMARWEEAFEPRARRQEYFAYPNRRYAALPSSAFEFWLAKQYASKVDACRYWGDIDYCLRQQYYEEMRDHPIVA